MKPPPLPWLRFRIVLLLCLFLGLFSVVFGRAFQLQVLQSQKLASLAERQYQRVVPLVPKRGIIYDRKREELAISVAVDSVFVQPGKVENPRAAAQKLGPILGKKPALLTKKMQEEKPFVWLERGITPGQRSAIEKFNFEGVHFLEETKRFYPNREVGAHVLGFSGIDSQGLEGVELAYDEFLRGQPGYIIISKDARGKVMNQENSAFRSAEEGCEILLTLDKNIQYLVEKELKKAVEACSARRGMAVVLNPKTGEILAMAVQPSFDPNRFSNYATSLLKNCAVTDVFEPGSTFKIFLAAAALEERVVSPRDVFFCENGVYTVGDRTLHDTHKYGWLTLTEIIKFSSNIGASKVGRKLGKNKFHQHMKSFGFGAKTGVDLPGEVSGYLPAVKHWSEVGLANISFGQGVSLTALQLATALSAVANGGVMMKPYIVKAVLDPKGNVLKESSPREFRRVLSLQTAQTLTRIMKTVMEEGGTGKAACLEDYEAAGKTGTAQKASTSGRGYSDKRVGSFIGFVPAANPQAVVLVVIDEPQGTSYGGVVAAPAFKAITEQILPYMGVYPKGVTYLASGDRKKFSPGTSAGEEQKIVSSPVSLKTGEGVEEPGVMPDFSGKSIRQVVQTAQRLGLDLKIEGNGKAVAQHPPPGQVLQGNTKGSVRFHSPI